jgi:serine/threonine protein kinase
MQEEMIWDEIKALRQLSACPNIVNLEAVYTDIQCIHLVLQYAPHGCLYDHIKERLQFKEEDARTIMAQLLLALNFMHLNGFVHRDIKPANLLVND